MHSEPERDSDLVQTVNRLLDTLQERDKRYRRAISIHRALLALVVVIAFGALGQSQLAMSQPAVPQSQTASVSAELTPEMRVRLREFDRELALIKQAIAESEEYEVGAMIAWFLYRVADSMEYMPTMSAEMKRMNQNMTAVPLMAAEMRQLNNNMAIMTHGIDRTMGNMGRMMPFMW